MNALLTRKKHSKIIAKLALKCGIIDKKFYDELYIKAYEKYKRRKRKPRFTTYYPELYYCVTYPYSGYADERPLIEYVRNSLMYEDYEWHEMDEDPQPKKLGSNIEVIRLLRRRAKAFRLTNAG